MKNKIFKTNLRKVCRRYKIKAADIVAGTGLTDSQVAEIYNPNSATQVNLGHAHTIVVFLRERTGTMINLDYLIDDEDSEAYSVYAYKMLEHFKERRAALDYYARNLERLQAEQDDFLQYLETLTERLKI